jgi:hypothetical protein
MAKENKTVPVSKKKQVKFSKQKNNTRPKSMAKPYVKKVIKVKPGFTAVTDLLTQE